MKKLEKIFLTFFLALIILLPSVVLADSTFRCVCADGGCTEYSSEAETNLKCKSTDALICTKQAGDCSKIPKKEVDTSKNQSAQNPKAIYTKLDNPLGGVKTPADIIGQVIRVAMGIMGGAVLLMVVKGAVSWIDAGGNPEKIESGTKTILWAVLGAVITVASYVILKAIIDAFFHPLGQ